MFVPVVTILLALFFAFMLNVGGRGRRRRRVGRRGLAASTRSSTSSRRCCRWRSSRCSSGPCTAATSGGLLNGLLIKLGLVDASSPIEWLNEPNLVLWCLHAVVVWHGVGFYLVLFSAAMQSIPKDIYEAALLDGAGRAQTFFRVTLPLLWDTVQTAWVYLGIAAMDMFVLVSTMTPGQTAAARPPQRGHGDRA